jgi:hypothetical protein
VIGSNSYGQCGLPTRKLVINLEKITFFNENLIKVAPGNDFTIFLKGFKKI